MSVTSFNNSDLRTANLDNLSLQQSKFINSNLNGLSISDSDLQYASFGNSDVGKLKIDNSLLQHITFDENSNISDDLRYQIYLATLLEPITSYADYLQRVFANQLVKRFGTIDNPLSKFY